MNGTTTNATDGTMSTVGSTSLFNGDVTNGGNLINQGTISISGVLCLHSRRICSNSSTLGLLSKPYPLPGRGYDMGAGLHAALVETIA